MSQYSVRAGQTPGRHAPHTYTRRSPGQKFDNPAGGAPLSQPRSDAKDTQGRVSQLVRQVHATEGKVCLVVTGAGTLALAWLFAEPGASRTVLDAQVPYAAEALAEYTGRRAQQNVSAGQAVLMAEAALERAKRLAAEAGLSESSPLAGISCTAAIVTDRVRRGDERFHIALSTSDGTREVMSLVMVKGARDRAGEEELCSRIILNAVAQAKGVTERLEVELVESECLEKDTYTVRNG